MYLTLYQAPTVPFPPSRNLQLNLTPTTLTFAACTDHLPIPSSSATSTPPRNHATRHPEALLLFPLFPNQLHDEHPFHSFLHVIEIASVILLDSLWAESFPTLAEDEHPHQIQLNNTANGFTIPFPIIHITQSVFSEYLRHVS
jgi:hypothetical protein